jgi:hypothetical protein
MAFHEIIIAPPFRVFEGKLNWRNIAITLLSATHML